MHSSSIIKASWQAPENIHAFTTLRYGMGFSTAPFDQFNLGNRYSDQGDDPLAVERNREQLCKQFLLPSAPHWLKQVHGIDVLRFDSAPVISGDFRKDEPIADASVTSQKNIVLSILTADCIPVLFCNIDGTEVAAAHAGWRGLADGVLENTVRAMNSKSGNIIALLGPAASPLAYEVGAEVHDAFLQRDKNAEAAFVQTRENHWRVDLYHLARMRLSAMGVTRIYGGEHCTINEPDKFFSHRRDRVTGRMASIIWIADC
ncbi:MAG: peptidoglycan editing factor PgeF [Arenimonas sp.]